MDSKGTYKVQKSATVLMADQHYFNYVFKKTEKIVSTVFYILHHVKDVKDSRLSLVPDIAQAAKDTLECANETLAYERHEATEALIKSVSSLVRLDSYLQLGRAAGVFSTDISEVLEAEIEGVTRSISRYTEDGLSIGGSAPYRSGLGVQTYSSEGRQKTGRPVSGNEQATQNAASESTTPGVSHSTRQDQIRDIISEKKTVSIKDISENIKDCSEKTIQRELNSMIEKGLVKREGERRWSRYSLL